MKRFILSTFVCLLSPLFAERALADAMIEIGTDPEHPGISFDLSAGGPNVQYAALALPKYQKVLTTTGPSGTEWRPVLGDSITIGSEDYGVWGGVSVTHTDGSSEDLYLALALSDGLDPVITFLDGRSGPTAMASLWIIAPPELEGGDYTTKARVDVTWTAVTEGGAITSVAGAALITYGSAGVPVVQTGSGSFDVRAPEPAALLLCAGGVVVAAGRRRRWPAKR